MAQETSDAMSCSEEIEKPNEVRKVELDEKVEIRRSRRKSKKPEKIHLEEDAVVEEKVFCNVCNKQYASQKSLRNHIVIHSDKRLSCSVCSKKFHRKDHLAEHVLVHTGEKPNSCNLCNKSFASKANHAKHMKIHASKVLHCDKCDRCFATQMQLTRHAFVHGEEKPYKCNLCDKEFFFQHGLNRHIVVHRIEGTVPADNFPNLYSNDSASNESLFSNSKSTSRDVEKSEFGETSQNPTEIQLFACEYCDKIFARQSGLDKHMILHTRMDLFSCDLCDKIYFTKIRFEKHLLTHKK